MINEQTNEQTTRNITLKKVFGINMKKYLRMIIKLLAQNIKIF
jgi:hypothetical protein